MFEEEFDKKEFGFARKLLKHKKRFNNSSEREGQFNHIMENTNLEKNAEVKLKL